MSLDSLKTLVNESDYKDKGAIIVDIDNIKNPQTPEGKAKILSIKS